MPQSQLSYLAGLTQPSPSGGSRAKYALKLRVGDQLEVRPEPSNRYAELRIALIHDGFHLGYVPTRDVWVAQAVKDGDVVIAEVSSIRTSGWWIFRKVRRIGLTLAVLRDSPPDEPTLAMTIAAGRRWPSQGR